MRIIAQGRKTGKTTELIHLSEQENKVILVRNHVSAKNIERQAKEMGCEIPRPVTVAQLKSQSFRGQEVKKGFLVDEAVAMLQDFLEEEIDTATVSIER